MAVKGRGAGSNPASRFERLAVDLEAPAGAPPTRFLPDASRRVIAENTSPDVGFDASLNPYRGCEHGCSYCYARPFHEYLGFSAGLDFETRILVKESAPELLRRELERPSWRPRVLALSGVTDPYQPIERRLEITRRCLEVLAELRHPVALVTKNRLVVRDADLLAGLARYGAVSVSLSVTTLDPGLAARLEPRASSPRRRLEAIAELAGAGVPVGVFVAPVVPGLTDHELPAILEAAAEAGASFARYIVLRLPHGVAELFDEWLVEHAPGRRERVRSRLRELRGGRLTDGRFHSRMRGEGVLAKQLRQLFDVTCRRVGLATAAPELSAASFRRPGQQLALFTSR